MYYYITLYYYKLYNFLVTFDLRNLTFLQAIKQQTAYKEGLWHLKKLFFK